MTVWPNKLKANINRLGPLFVLSFDNLIRNIWMQKRSWTSWVSNPGPQDGSLRRIQLAMTATNRFGVS